MAKHKYVYCLWSDSWYNLNLYEYFGSMMMAVEDIMEEEGFESDYVVRDLKKIVDADKCVEIDDKESGFHLAIERRKLNQGK